jgi:hypothetical protein
MAVPGSKESRLFYRCAKQRYEEARILLKAEKPTGAVYLAGYGIECMLKALVLSVIPSIRADAILQSFRGNRAHNYQWLRAQYLVNGGAALPREVNQCFTLVDQWSTDLRYMPGTIKAERADSFIGAARVIIHWADTRLE